MSHSEIGIYGMGVMGQNLALNLEENGFSVSIFNRISPGEKTIIRDFLNGKGEGKKFYGAQSPQSLVNSIETPRKILLMVKAGNPVDQVIGQLLPFLQKGDIIIDGGNSHYNDTLRRIEELKASGILFVGMGVSGGEKGARFGASLMPGGNREAWPAIQPLLEKIAAKAFDDSPCCAWVGDGGAGHLIKMVHNGIEYADMQLLAEVYHILKTSLELNALQISDLLKDWNKTSLNSYLIEITANILTVTDDSGQPLVDKILDSAGEKGTGKWIAAEALSHNVPLPGITQAVYSRFISNFVDTRYRFSEGRSKPKPFDGDSTQLIDDLKNALLASRMTAYAEGFFMISSMENEYGWNMNYESIAKIWQGGCIIRSILLKEIEMAWEKDAELRHLFLSEDFAAKLADLQTGWRSSVGHAAEQGIPAPCMMAYLSLYDSLRCKSLPASLIQAQRDYFGAHTYERIDKPRGQFFHTNWEKT